MYHLAHISDVHLPGLPRPQGRDLMSKRAAGYLSWMLNRRFLHRQEVLDCLVADLKAATPDHIAFTGDLVNIALPEEFANGSRFLTTLGSPDQVSFVPGNHDAYVPLNWEDGIGRWQDYMAGDYRPGGNPMRLDTPRFPYVRVRRNIALIGVSTAIPAPWGKAWGELGSAQLASLSRLLAELRLRGFYRVLMIHHPPVPGLTSARRALLDGANLRRILETEGAELVIYGHNHIHQRTELRSPSGPVHLIGVPSASALPRHGKPPAAWYSYRIRRQAGGWQTAVTVRSFDPQSRSMRTSNDFVLEG